MNIAVVGTGYVGLVTGICLAEIGHHVICIDHDPDKISGLKQGKLPIYEPGLGEMLAQLSGSHSSSLGSITFTTTLEEGVLFGDVLFITVGTPSLPSGDPDLQFVEAVARQIGHALVKTDSHTRYRVIVNKSTVPVGSGDWVRMMILEGVAQAIALPVLVESGSRSMGKSGKTLPIAPLVPAFDVISNPEFLREGSALWDSFHPDRLIIGSNSPKAIDIMRRLYEPIISRSWEVNQPPQPPIPFVVTDLTSAEMIKYAANAFLATKISFINEIANICERVGADITQVALGIGLDARIGPKFLNAGIGWGGSCFPKDVSALIRMAADYHYDARLLKASVTINHQQRLRVIEKLQGELKVLNGKTIGLLGLTFKPDTDDLRDAPGLTIIESLLKLGTRVKAYDPILSRSQSSDPTLAMITLTDSPYQLAANCDALVLITEWEEFQDINFVQLAGIMHRPLIIDGRNFLNADVMTQAGFFYVGMGR